MTDFVKINGQAVRVTRFYRRMVNAEPGGVPVDEIELVVMLRGRTVQRAFQDLLRQPAFQVEIPDQGSLQMTLASASLQTSGTGEAAAHRYDITFRETVDSAARRKRDSVPSPAEPESTAKIEDSAGNEDPEAQEIDWGTASVAWATALRERHAAVISPPDTPPEEPLSPAELAGVEAVLVGLRLEALIAALERAGVVRQQAIDEAFRSLVADRFITEATPVIGEDAARRAARAARED